jgi:hypothetical protein
MGKLICMMCLVGIGVALVRRSARAGPAGPAVRGDVPERLLRWGAGLLSARREEWGQAMLGELDYIDGRGRRWRFATGCAGAALLLPPWGRAAAAVWAMVVAAAGAAGVYASVALRYRLGAGDWGTSGSRTELAPDRLAPAAVCRSGSRRGPGRRRLAQGLTSHLPGGAHPALARGQRRRAGGGPRVRAVWPRRVRSRPWRAGRSCPGRARSWACRR